MEVWLLTTMYSEMKGSQRQEETKGLPQLGMVVKQDAATVPPIR